MKNLKKVLSLVLALALALSLMTTAFGAVTKASSLTGYDKVGTDYAQAVDMMVALGVIDGVSGDIQAQGNVTREQAAKIICTMLMGSNASQLSTTSSYFTDVPATRWSAPYIAYCVEQGIVSGVGGGKFNPTGNVTGNQFAKMLLVALGYNASTEGYTGTNWAVNVSADATDAGLYKGATGVNKNTAATREQACLYAWNTVKATLVEYATTGTNITIGNTNINVGGSKATAVYSSADSNRNLKVGTANASGAYTFEFGEKYFTTLKKTNTAADDFGRPASEYKVGTTVVGTYAGTPVVTYTAKTLAAKVATDLSGYTIKNAAGTAVNINNTTAYTNAGDFTTYAGVVVINGVSASKTIANAAKGTVAAAIAAETANGKTVQVFADTDNNVTAIVEISYTVATIASVTKTTAATTYSIKPVNGTAITAVDYVDGTDTISYMTAPAKGDVVTYVTANGTTYVYPTTSAVGVQTSVSTAGIITVGGTNYTVAGGVTDGTDLLTYANFSNSSSSVTINLDQFGYAVKSTAAAASTDYAYIIGTYGTLASSVDGDVPSAQVKVLKADGSIATYTLKLTKLTADTTTQYTFSSATEAGAAGDYIIAGTTIGVYNKSASNDASTVKAQVGTLAKVYGYTISDTTISLQALAAASGSMTVGGVYYDSNVDDLGYGVTSKAGSAADTVILSSSTTYVIYNSTKGTASVYNGVSSLPTSTAGALDGAKVVMKASGTAVGTASVVFYSNASAISSDTVTYAYIASAPYTQNTVDGTTTYGYTGFLADGTTVALTTSANSNVATSGIYAYTTTNTIGSAQVVSAGTYNANDQYIYAKKMAVSGSVLTITTQANGTLYYSITDNTKVVLPYSAVTGLTGADGNMGYVVLEKNSSGSLTGNVAAIFVTAAG